MKAWTKRYLEWVKSHVHFEQPAPEATLQDYFDEVEHAAARIERLEKSLDEAIGKAPEQIRAVIEALQTLRGAAQLTAATIVSEIGSFSGFEPRRLMGCSGLALLVKPNSTSFRPREMRPLTFPVPPYHWDMKLMLQLAPLLFLVARSQGFQQAIDSAEAEREKDSYLIYSLILTNPQTSHGPDNNQQYLIGQTTVPGTPPQPCVRPPKEREAEFQEVLVDFERRKSTPRELRSAFSIRKPYQLLTAGEVAAFTRERSFSRVGATAADARFQGVTDIFRLSDVYFNQRRTLALTAVSTWCGLLCGLSEWKVFEKLETGQWKELREWVGCSTIAANTDGAGVRFLSGYSKAIDEPKDSWLRRDISL